jgi:NMD protein affecting ribosome stability and mRNA decay
MISQKINCIVCGKPSEVESFCSDCWLKRQVLFEIKDVQIKICDCKSFFSSGRWIRFDSLEEMIKEVVRKNIITQNKLTKINMSLRQVGNKVKITVECSGIIKPCKKPKTETKESNVLLRKVTCEECKKHLASYYEAVIQLRVEELLDRIIDEGGESVINVNKVRGGQDIIFFKDDVARRIVDKLRKEGFSITKSNVFVVEKNNKKIYRNYYSVKKGDKHIP